MVAVCAILTVPWMFRNRAVHGAFTTAGAAGQNLVTFVAIIHLGDFSFDEPLVTAVDADPKMAIARREIPPRACSTRSPSRRTTRQRPRHLHPHPRRDLDIRGERTRRCKRSPSGRSWPGLWSTLRDVAQNVFSSFLSDTSKSTNHSNTIGRSWDKVGWRGEFRRFVGPRDAGPGGLVSVPGQAGQHRPARAHGRGAIALLRSSSGSGWRSGRPAGDRSWRSRSPTLGVIGIHAATVGAVPRYRVPVEPPIDVVAVGALAMPVSAGPLRRQVAAGSDHAPPVILRATRRLWRPPPIRRLSV